MSTTNNDYYFLAGNGEMANLIRAKDWSKSPLGTPATWPQSLRTTLSIVLNSKFPMFLWWGSELSCFYNDAYRPSLGNKGKHPTILGQKGQEAWPEIWPIIHPLLQGVLSGKGATWSENQLIPFYRNGTIEDIYWTFSHSPVYDESGSIAGVMTICQETTEIVTSFKKLEENNSRYINNIMQTPTAMCILRGENHIVEIANKPMLQLWGTTAEKVMNKPIFEGLPEAKNQGFENLLNTVYVTGEKFVANERPVELPRNGKIETVYVDFVYDALKETDGTISGVVAIATEVTEKIEARKKIEQNEERLNVIIEASELGTWELNLKTREPKYSQRYLEIIGGYTENIELTHEQLLKHLYPDDIPARNIAFKNALATGNLCYESRIIWLNGSIHWMEGKGTVFYDSEGVPDKMIGTIRDITDEKKHQQELEESEQKFRLLANSMPQQVWTSDIEGNLNYFNQSVYDFSGLTQEETNQGGWLRIVHPDDVEENVKIWNESIKTGKDFLFEHRFRRNDGEYRWQLSRAIPQIDENGKIQMWVGTSTDIQDQKNFANELEKQVKERTKELILINESLEKSEERYHLMVEEIQDYAILYLDPNGIVKNWNVGAQKIKGYKAEEIIGENFSVFYAESDRNNNLPQKLLEIAKHKGKAKQEGWRIRKNGTFFWANVVITAIHNKQKKLIGFSKITHDLTERKKAADKLNLNALELQQKNIELEKMNNELQSFAYISSHDLQEPLRKIQIFATQIIEKESQNLSDAGKDKFKRMQNAAQRMQALINDLLTYSKTNIQERKFEKTNLSLIIQEVKEDLKEEIEQKKAAILTDKVCDDINVAIIPFQFRQLLYNLLGNSIKFSRQDVSLQIEIKCKIAKGNILNNPILLLDGDYCHLEISDNGIGFEQEYGQKIFEVFQRLHGKNEYVGTGIGLAIVKKIIDNHNGIITAKGEQNKGATFEIFIPIV
jgi:PAS domain S-box-containing protein